MTSILNVIGGIASAIGAWISYRGEQLRLHNTPEIQANDKARKMAALRDAFEARADNLEAVRKVDAEK